MINITEWLNVFLQELNNTFGKRVWFVGLQGSYARGEATENSDIDVVVILDELSVLDIQNYNSMLNNLSHRELTCGFISGKKELQNWEPSDLFTLYYDTNPIIGSLDELLILLDNEALDRAIKIGVCNIYHGCVHNILHSKKENILKGLYKSATFVIQAIHLKQTEKYTKHLNKLIKFASSEEEIILNTFLEIKNGKDVDFKEASETLFNWAKNLLNK